MAGLQPRQQPRLANLRSSSQFPPHSRTDKASFGSRQLTISNSSSTPNIAVVGGGVMGLTAALCLQQKIPTARLTIVAEQVAADTTSEGAAGLWKPYAISGTPSERVNRWGQATFDHYMRLYFSPEAPLAGVLLTPAYELFRSPVPDPDWAKVVPNFRHLTLRELAVYDPTGSHTHGWSYETCVAEGRLYLAWLLRQVQAAGGAVERRHVASLSSLSAFDAVVNCAGLGARELAPDHSVQPIRGHVVRVRAPWVRHHVEAEGHVPELPAYVIPNADTVVLGGSKRYGDYDRVPRAEDRAAILQRCTAVVPSLAAAEVVGEWVGLRPGRPSVRLELESLSVSGRCEALPVVHSYGHGGSGLTLAWGCAADVADLVAAAL